jgi:hypothetical protein
MSAHPHSCLKGLIAGEMKRYWIQNNATDFKTLLVKFLDCLRERDHTIPALTPILQNTAMLLDSKLSNNPTSSTANERTLYIHKEHHPNGLKRSNIRRLYNEILEPHLSFNRMTVAMSWPINLRDILTSAKLRLPENIDIQELIDSLRQSPSSD